jgi:flagellar motor switch protein FliM
VRFGDYLNSIPLPCVLSVFKAEEWENFGLFTVDSSLIYSIIDVLLGGRRGQASLRIEGRPYTTIETNLVEAACRGRARGRRAGVPAAVAGDVHHRPA